MNVICENCGATYKGPISPYSKFVKCPYCNSVIQISKEVGTVAKRVVYEEVVSTNDFNINKFASFLYERGIKSFDPISGILSLRNQEVTVNGDGSISGPEPLKSRVEKWVQIFMSKR